MLSISSAKRRLYLCLSVLFALSLWQILAMLIGQTILLPTPLAVLLRLCSIWQVAGFWTAIALSGSRIVGGFLLALILGLVLGTLAGRIPLCGLLFSPFAFTIKSVPVASFIVICLIWLSSSQLSIFISFLMVLPVVYHTVQNGIEHTDRALLEACHVFNLSWYRRLLYVWLPQLRPFLLSACTTGFGLAWKAGITAEIIGIPPSSIGRMFYDAKLYLNTTDLFAWTVIVLVLSLLFERGFLFLLRAGFRRLESL